MPETSPLSVLEKSVLSSFSRKGLEASLVHIWEGCLKLMKVDRGLKKYAFDEECRVLARLIPLYYEKNEDNISA